MTRKAGLNSNTLKLLAVVAMICQHVTIFFIPTTNPWYDPLFCFGMITAPIMCFFIAEGYYHTHSRRKYLELLLLYNGQRGRKSKWYQWGYYLIYPIHFMVLYAIELLVRKNRLCPLGHSHRFSFIYAAGGTEACRSGSTGPRPAGPCRR